LPARVKNKRSGVARKPKMAAPQPVAWWRWEVATGAPASAYPGLLGPRWLGLLTAGMMVIFIGLLWPMVGLGGALLALPLARLVALDVTTHTLPDVYTLPLLAVALLHAGLGGDNASLVAALAVLALYHAAGRVPGLAWARRLGGGDYKLLAALLAGLGLPLFFSAVAVGCALWLPIACLRPKAPVPLGVPLIVGAVAVTAFWYW
jgi:prepilin signal peptidase PulO-like enzyme (type II secretory pathway)